MRKLFAFKLSHSIILELKVVFSIAMQILGINKNHYHKW